MVGNTEVIVNGLSGTDQFNSFIEAGFHFYGLAVYRSRSACMTAAAASSVFWALCITAKGRLERGWGLHCP